MNLRVEYIHLNTIYCDKQNCCFNDLKEHDNLMNVDSNIEYEPYL